MAWAPPHFEPEAFATAVRVEFARLAPLCPDIDPGDLLLAIQCRLRPFGTGRRYFLREQSPGVYVF